MSQGRKLIYQHLLVMYQKRAIGRSLLGFTPGRMNWITGGWGKDQKGKLHCQLHLTLLEFSLDGLHLLRPKRVILLKLLFPHQENQMGYPNRKMK